MGEKNGWMAVPQFGGWDRPKAGGATNYSMVFEQARENRKHRKSDFRGSLGNDEDLVDDNTPRRPIQPHPFMNNDQLHAESPSKTRRILSIFACGKA